MRGLAKFFSSGDGRPLPRLPMERQPMTQPPAQGEKLPRDISLSIVQHFQVEQEGSSGF